MGMHEKLHIQLRRQMKQAELEQAVVDEYEAEGTETIKKRRDIFTNWSKKDPKQAWW